MVEYRPIGERHEGANTEMTRYAFDAETGPAGVEDAAAGEFRRIHPEGFEALKPAYRAYLEGIDLATRRSDDWWRHRVFHTHRTELFCYAWERDGDVRGYLLYEVHDGRLRVDEVAYADAEAYLNLLRFCYYHDAQVSELELGGHSADRLVDVVADRGAVEVSVSPGQMVRVVDVPAALEAVPYPGVEDREVTLAVADDHADWNDATFRVRVEEGAATVEESDADPDAGVDVGTLSQLLVGYLPVERARHAGLAVHTPGAAADLAALFPDGEPYLPEAF